jgi:hypothetical protein
MVRKIVYTHEETQIVFKSNPELKDAALEKAKHEGVTLKAVLCMAMRAYVNDEMVMSMTKREEHYEEEDDKPPMEKAPPGEKIEKKIKGGTKIKPLKSKKEVRKNF